MNKTLFSTLLWLLLPADWAGGHIAAGLCLNMQTVLTSVAQLQRGVLLWRCQRQRKEIRLAKIVKISHQQISLPKSVPRWTGAFSEYWVPRNTVDTFIVGVLITIRIKRSIVKIGVTPACCQPATPHCGTIVNLTIHEILWQKNCHLHISSDVLITKHLVLFFCQN